MILLVDKLDYRVIAHWVKSMMAKGKAPKTIHNIHGLISTAMNTAEMLGYITRNPCRGVQLPNIEKAEDEAMFRTQCRVQAHHGGDGGGVQGFHGLPGHDRHPHWRSHRIGRGGRGPAVQTAYCADQQGVEAGWAEPVLCWADQERGW
ncbi:hypothetical protein NMQ03_09490 [Arthrobacter sp. DNA4]|uniref:hypothetical protein n=1 Tax=Arthrobacter sp. DNA4 TaxID=2963432 RepID=UPI0020CF571A|nr:hypothetical protein [Arthrobacter sp. DNA4]UTT71286.1 hypothetical protein NMQ03_09490 [Arthrobacter sp. DNA4]